MSRFINACEINVSMLFKLILANIKILLCFFSPVTHNNFFTIPVVREKTTVKEAPAKPTQEFQQLLHETRYSKYQKMQTKQ